jgi:hypothetical protein
MREIAEFRVVERFASMLFSDVEGKRLGDSIRKVRIDTRDPRFAEVGRLHHELRAKQGSPFFHGWSLHCTYTKEEAEYAKLKNEQDARKPQSVPIWHQLVINSVSAEIVAPTRAGIDPFDDDPDGQCCCPSGHLLGLNLLSEVTISAMSRGDSDFVCSRQYLGVRRGLLRPRRIIFISPKARTLFLKNGTLEVAHLG